MEQYEFGREFRLKILALLLDESWMMRYGGFIIDPNYFEQDDEIAFAKAIMDYRTAYNQSPADPYDTIELMDTDRTEFVLAIYQGATEWDLSLASDRAVQFAREQAAKLAILDGVDDIERGDVQAAIDRMTDALRVGQDLSSPGLDPHNDVYSWLYEYWDEKVPTGWYHVDTILEGGVGPGELGVILGPQNKGKSMCLINIGHAAISMFCGKNVIHLSHEMSERQVAKRYAARAVFRFPHRGDDLEAYAEELVSVARRTIKGKVRVIGGADKMTVAQIRAHIDRLVAEGFNPGLIIDDYPDLVVPIKHYGDRRFELSELYEWFRVLGGPSSYNVPVWVASQANRGGYSKEIITLADIAEDITKASTADVIISLCQTFEESRMDRCRLFGAKIRDGASKFMVEAKYYGAQQAIISTGYATFKEGGDGN